MLDLKEIFDKQAKLQKHAFGIDLPAVNEKLAMYYGFGLYGEIGEVFAADKQWKPCHKGPRNHDEVREELTDCLLFLVNLMLAQGMSAEDIEAEYRKKYEKVIERINIDKENGNVSQIS